MLIWILLFLDLSLIGLGIFKLLDLANWFNSFKRKTPSKDNPLEWFDDVTSSEPNSPTQRLIWSDKTNCYAWTELYPKPSK